MPAAADPSAGPATTSPSDAVEAGGRPRRPTTSYVVVGAVDRHGEPPAVGQAAEPAVLGDQCLRGALRPAPREQPQPLAEALRAVDGEAFDADPPLADRGAALEAGQRDDRGTDQGADRLGVGRRRWPSGS